MEKVISLLRRYNAIVGYLFGSRADGSAYPCSDYDLGVLFRGRVPSIDVQMVMKAELEELLRIKADIIFLQKANIKLQFEVIRSGKILFSDDEEYRTDFEESVLRRYMDFMPFVNRLRREIAEEIKGGGYFG